MTKENDLFLNLLLNPLFNAFDFKQVGLNVDNTSIEKKDVYKDLDFVKSNPTLQTNGVFDEAKFDAAYNVALANYNQMSDNKVSEEIGRHAHFFRDNIFAPTEQRDKGLNFSIERTANPLRELRSTIRVGEVKENPLSLREIALTQRVWDERTQSWLDAPNDSFFANFGDTRVLAQWDEDGEHVDPITGLTVEHKKGDKKINDNGTYYYENLNGRSIYGREVLSKFDTLTTDGSGWNKFDVFDSDDKDKNIVGTLAKNALKIVPAFIPGVAPWYIGARVTIGVTDLLSKLGNMVTNNESDLFHGIEGYMESLGFSSSDYSRGGIAGTVTAQDPNSPKYITPHTWSLENLINMSADVFTQLAEQRWMFKYPPRLFKGEMGMNEKLQERYVKDIFARRQKEVAQQLSGDLTRAKVMGDAEQLGAITGEMSGINMLYALNLLKNYMEDYMKIGKLLSMGYMTGITVADSYGEAIEEGASPTQAALLSLGYALGEYQIIRSDLGKWILPELRLEKARWREIGKKLSEMGLEDKKLVANDKMKAADWVKRILHIGKQRADLDYEEAGKGVFKLTKDALVANALGEGVEETSEELLYDLTKSLYNVFYKLGGSLTHLTAFDGIFDDKGSEGLSNLFSRYALSFVGGTIGGGLGEANATFREAAKIKNVSAENAYENLVQIVKEGKADDFLKMVDDTTWASKDLTFDPQGDNYRPVQDERIDMSQDAAVKSILSNEVKMIKDILASEGANLSNDSVLLKLSGVDNPRLEFKANALSQSKMATKYIQEYNALLTRLVEDKRTLIGLEAQSDKTDSQASAENAKPEGENVTALRARIKQEEEALQEYLQGKKTPEFVKKTLFEVTSPLISAFKNTTFINYVEGKYKRPIKDISEQELEAERANYKKISELEGGDLVELVYDVFERANIAAAPILQQYVGKYFDLGTALGIFNTLTTRGLAIVNNLVESDQETIASDLIKGRYEGDVNDGGNFNKNSDPMDFFAQSLIMSLEKNGIDVSLAKQRYIDLLEKNKNDEEFKKDKSKFRTGLLDILVSLPGKGDGLLQRKDVIDTLLFDIENAPFINAAQRKELHNVLDRLERTLKDYAGNPEDPDTISKIVSIKNAIDRNPNYSPVLEFLDSFGISTRTDKKTQPKISSIIESVEKLLINLGERGDIEGFGFDEDIEKQIDNALGTIQLAKAIVNAARTDKAKFGDMFGYNKTVNEITPNSTLAEIDSNTADTILQEIDAVETKLKYYQNIANINSGNKLKEHDKTGVKANMLLFKRFIEKFIDPDTFPPSSWDRDSIEKLKSKFGHSSFKILNGLVTKFGADGNSMDLNISDWEAYQTEVKEFETAIHEFFLANKANIEDTDKLSEILDPTMMNTHQLDKKLLTKNAEDLSDSGFVWWLASLAAVDPNDLKAQYAKTFDGEGKIAPVPGLELAVQIGYSALMNGKVFGKFTEAYNKALKKYSESMTDDEWDAAGNGHKIRRKTLYYDSDVSVNFARTILTEGVAGSGKSKGVAEQIIRMIGANEEAAKQLLSNVWIVHTSKNKAYELAERLFGKENAEKLKDNCFSHSGLMLNISGTNPAGHTWNETTDANGNVVIDKSDLVAEEGKMVRYNYSIKPNIKKPSLIITDEVSHLSVPSLKLIDDFAEISGCSHLVFGDFDLSGINTSMENINVIDSNGKVVETLPLYNAFALNTNFIHGFKLGQSLRADNKVKEDNNYLLQLALVEIRKGGNDSQRQPELTFKYVENDLDILLGDKIIQPPSSDAEYADLEEQIKKLLKKTIELDPNAKLGYIYDRQFEMEGGKIKVDSNGKPVKEIDSKLTEIMRKLNNSEEFKDKIDFKAGNAAQGDENPYYVMDLSRSLDDDNWDTYISDFYTGVTRSQRGSLIVKRTNFDSLTIKNIKLEKSPKSPLTEKAIKKFTERKRELYKKIYGESPNPIPYQRYTTSKTRTSDTGGTPSPGEDVEAPEGYYPKGTVIQDGDGKTYKIVQYNLDDKGKYWVVLENLDDATTLEPMEIEKIKDWNPTSSDDTSEAEKGNGTNLDYKGDINNSGDDVQMIHHSFNVDETGLVFNDDGSISFGEMADSRFDNVIGLYKLFHPTDPIPSKINPSDPEMKDIQFLLESVRKIRSAGRTINNEENLIEVLKRIFEGAPDALPENIAVRFMYKSSEPYENMDMDIITRDDVHKEKFVKPSSEQVEHFENGLSKLNTSTISIIYLNKDTGEELVEVPIATDTNPITLAFTKGFGKDDASGQDITSWVADNRKIILDDKSIAPNKKFITLLNKLKNALTNTDLGKHPQAKKLLEQIRIFEAHLKIIGGRVKFLTTTDEKGNEQWLIPARDWETTGIIINDDENFTMVNKDDPNYIHYEGQWLSYDSLNGRKMILSKRVYQATHGKTIKKDNGREIVIKPGQPFVIATDNINDFGLSVSDQTLYDALEKTDRDDVTIIYIEPPTKSIRDYLELLHDVYDGNKKGDEKTNNDAKIGTLTTSYKLISELWRSPEGKQFITERIQELFPGNKATLDEVIKDLGDLIERFDKISDNNSGKGDENKLIEELKKRPKEEFKSARSLPRFILMTGFTTENTKYSNYFDKLLRLLVLGSPATTGMLVDKPSTQDSLNRIAKIEPIIKNGEDYKYGIFTHVNYKQGADADKLSGTILVADIEVGEIRFNAKLDTGVFKTKGERSKEYQKQKSDMLTPDNDNEDTRMYVGYDDGKKKYSMKSICSDTPTKPKRGTGRRPGPAKKSKEDLISTKVSDFISDGRYILSKQTTNDIVEYLRTLGEDDIKSFKILEDYINKNTESVAHIDSGGTFYFFTIDELKFGSSDNTLKTHELKYTGGDTILDETTGKEYKIVNFNMTPTLKSFELLPKSTSTSSSRLNDEDILIDRNNKKPSVIYESDDSEEIPAWKQYLGVFDNQTANNMISSYIFPADDPFGFPDYIHITVGTLRTMLADIKAAVGDDLDINLISDNIDTYLDYLEGVAEDGDPVIDVLNTMKQLLGEIEDNACNNILVVI